MNVIAKPMSHLDELLALRPAADASSLVIQAAMDAIREKGKEYLSRADEMRGRRPQVLLKLSGDHIIAMDKEIALLAIGAEQAAAMVPALAEQHKERRRVEWIDGLQAKRAVLAPRPEELAVRFQGFWRRTVAEFLALKKEYEAVAVDCERFNADLERAQRESGNLQIESINRSALNPIYFDHVCFPQADLPASGRNVGYLHKGKNVVIDDTLADAERSRQYTASFSRA